MLNLEFSQCNIFCFFSLFVPPSLSLPTQHGHEFGSSASKNAPKHRTPRRLRYLEETISRNQSASKPNVVVPAKRTRLVFRKTLSRLFHYDAVWFCSFVPPHEGGVVGKYAVVVVVIREKTFLICSFVRSFVPCCTARLSRVVCGVDARTSS